LATDGETHWNYASIWLDWEMYIIPGHPLIRKRDLLLLNGETFLCVCVGGWWFLVKWRRVWNSFLFFRIGLLFKMPVGNFVFNTKINNQICNYICWWLECVYYWCSNEWNKIRVIIIMLSWKKDLLPLRRGAKGEREAEWWRRSWWWAIWRGRVLGYSFFYNLPGRISKRSIQMRELDKPWTFPFHKKGSEMEEIEELVCARQWTNGNWNGWPRVVRDGRRLKLMCDAPTNSSWITIAAGRFFFLFFDLLRAPWAVGRWYTVGWEGYWEGPVLARAHKVSSYMSSAPCGKGGRKKSI
jgi:hypothetical protein